MENYYEEMTTGEKVYKDNAEDYAMDVLGIEITPKGNSGELTKEQTEFIVEFTDWFFSGNWILKKEKEDYYTEAFDVMMDNEYMENLEKRLLDEK